MASIQKLKKKPVKRNTAKKKINTSLREMPTRRQISNIEAKKRFIKALGHYGTITRACKEAGISNTTYYLWTDPDLCVRQGVDPDRYYDEEFTELAREAYLNRFQDRVKDTGIDRALDGWTDYHYDRNGNLSREEFKYDSAVLQMLMKKADPELRDKPGDVNVGVTQNNTVHNHNAAALDSLTPQQKMLLLKAAELQAQNTESQDSESAVIEGQVIPSEKKSNVRKRRAKTPSSTPS